MQPPPAALAYPLNPAYRQQMRREETILALAASGMTMLQIAAAAACVKQTVRNVLERRGITLAEQRQIRCVSCGVLVKRPRQSMLPSGIHSCGDPLCRSRARYEWHRRGQVAARWRKRFPGIVQDATCSFCGVVLASARATVDGVHTCMARDCRRQRRRQQRATQRARLAQQATTSK